MSPEVEEERKRRWKKKSFVIAGKSSLFLSLTKSLLKLMKNSRETWFAFIISYNLLYRKVHGILNASSKICIDHIFIYPLFLSLTKSLLKLMTSPFSGLKPTLEISSRKNPTGKRERRYQRFLFN